MKTALLVIDYINGIIGGSCKEFVNKHPIVTNTNSVLSTCRQHDIPVYHVRLAFDKQYSNSPKHSKMFSYVREHGLFQLGNEDTEFVPALDIQPNETIINKTAASPFHSEGLMESLQAQGVERLIFAGVATDNAIDIGVREAHDAGFYTIVVEDACGASTENFHQWTIAMLEKIANEIVSTDKLASSL